MGIVSQPFQKQLNPLLLWEGADSDRNLRHCLHLHVWVQWSTFGWSVHSGIFWGDRGHRTHVHQGTSYPQQKIRLPIYIWPGFLMFSVWGHCWLLRGRDIFLRLFVSSGAARDFRPIRTWFRLSVSCGTSDRIPNFGQKVVICSSCTGHRQQIGNHT